MIPILPDLASLIAAEIAVALPDLASCEASAGRFDLKELAALGAKPPAVRIAVLGIGGGKAVSGPHYHHLVQIAAYIVTADAPALPRDRAALAIVERIVSLVHGRTWGNAAFGEPEGVAADNLFSQGTRKQGVALWAVAWRQPVGLGPVPAHAGALPAEWYATGLAAGGDPVRVGDGA
jgi:hypothetical protein